MSSQDSKMPGEHGLSLRLREEHSWGDDFQLGYSNFDRRVTIAMTTSKSKLPITLFCRGLSERGHLDVSDALGTGLLELVDHATQTVVAFPRVEELAVGQQDVSAENYYHKSLGLIFDSTAQIWRDTLQTGKTYDLRLGPAAFDENVLWCRYRNADAVAANSAALHETPPLRLERNKIVRFTVYNDPAPPTFTAVFSVEPAVCRIPPTDGPIKVHNMTPLPDAFKFVVDVTSTAPAPITVCIDRSVFGSTLPIGVGLNSLAQFAHCVEADSGKDVEFDWGFMCFNSDPRPAWPDDGAFVEVPPAGSATARFVQAFPEYDQQTAFQPGLRYRAQMSEEAKEGFSDWMFGTKEQVLRGTVEERLARWNEAHPGVRKRIEVQQVNEPVEFDAVG